MLLKIDTSSWIYWDANGNGGITTTSPQAKIDIYTDENYKLNLSDPDDSDGNNILVIFTANSVIKYNMGFYNSTTDYFAINPDGGTGLCINGSGFVGVCITNPAYELDINGEGHCNGNFYLTSLTPGSVLFLGAGSSAYQAIYEDNSNFFWDESSGYLGIGTNAPGYLLELGTDSAGKPSTNTWTIVSDKKIKKDVIPFNKYGLKDLLKLNPIEYSYNGYAGYKDDGKRHVGYISQEVEKIIPEMVQKIIKKIDKKEIELKTVNTHLLSFAIIEALREINDRLKKLEE